MLNRAQQTVWEAHRARQKAAARQQPAPVRRWHGLAIALVAAIASAAAAFIAALFMLPPHLVFPVTAAGLVVAAGTMALIAWASPPEVGAARLIYWDFAGALTLLGLCAALLGEPEQAVALLERDRM